MSAEKVGTTALGPRFTAKQLAWIVVVAAIALLATIAMNNALPVILAGVIAALVPARHGWQVRAALAVITGAMVLFVIRMWPVTAEEMAQQIENAGPESSTLLSWILGLPLAGAIAVLFMPRQAHRILQWSTLLIMLATLGLCIPMMRTPMAAGFHFNQDVVWLERFGIHYHVAIDGISMWLVVLTAFIMPIAAYVSFGSINARIKDWCFALLLLEGALVGAFVAIDLFLFYVFWELCLIPMYVMIGVWGGQNRIKAAIKFFLYTMFGSVLMLAAILYLAYTYSKVAGHLSFDYFELQRVLLPRHVGGWLWLAFTLSFVIKVPMFPVHTWLPDAHTEAPTAGSIVLAAIMLKLGTYGYLRFSVGLFPEASAEWAANLAGVAVLGGILYGALCAWKQDDFKRLVAYSSVAHLGYVMLGIFAMSQASLEGAVLQMVNHGVSTGALFLLVGVIYDRRHTRMIDEFGGLTKPMPIYATMFVIATLASVGLPGTNGFIGEFMVITGTFASTRLGHFNGVQAVGAAIGVILGALYMLSVVQKVFFGPVKKKANRHLTDINGRELVATAPLVLAIFAIGLFPNIFLVPIRDACARVAADMGSRQTIVRELNEEDAAAHKRVAPPENEKGYKYEGEVRLLARRPEATPPALSAPQEAAAQAEGK